MRQYRSWLLAVLLILAAVWAATLWAQGGEDKPAFVQAPDRERKDIVVPFSGSWMPAVDPAQIGAENYKTLQNTRYNDAGLEGVAGYSKINTTALSVAQEYSDTTKWIEADANSRLSVTSTEITATALQNNETAMVYQDFGAGAINTSVSARFRVKVNTVATGAVVGCFGVADVLATMYDTIWTSSSNSWFVYIGNAAGVTRLYIAEAGGGLSHYYIASSDPINVGQNYYCEVVYNEASGTYGSLTMNIYTDSGYSTLFDTLSLTLHEKFSFRYAYAVNAYDAPAQAFAITCEIGDLSISTGLENGTQLRTEYTTGSHVLVSGATFGTDRVVKENTTDPPTAGVFSDATVYTATTGAGTARFSQAPNGQVAYANGVESCIWAGDEMAPGGFYAFAPITATTSAASTDFTATTPKMGVGLPYTNFSTAGFRPGMVVDISGSTSNNKTFQIGTLSSSGGTYNVLAFTSTPAVTNETDQAVTLTASPGYGGYTDLIDYTAAAVNDLATTGNVAPLGNGGIDASTVLMLHCDGADGSTTVTDSSASAHVMTITPTTDDAQIDTAAKKFGTGSLLFDGTNDLVTTADSADWFMSTGSFTIDFWLKFNTWPSGYWAGIFQQGEDSANQTICSFIKTTGYKALVFSIYSGSATTPMVQVSGFKNDLALGTWYHVAVIRGWGGVSTDFALTVDGTAIGTTSASGVWPNFTSSLDIGVAGGYYLNGAIDEFRISKGVARWTSDFTPPAIAYRTGGVSDWITLSTRPLKGIKYYVSGANVTDSTQTVRCWNGSSFETLTITADGTANPSTVTLAQTGTVSFASTVGTARPLHFEDRYLYAYWTTLSAGGADVYKATVDAPFQPLVDVWDQEVYAPVAGCFVYDATSGDYTDASVAITVTSNGTGVAVGADLDGLTTSEHVIVITERRSSGFQISMCEGQNNTVTCRPAVEYWGPDGWVDVGLLTDSTSTSDTTWTPLSQSGRIAWTPPDASGEIAQNLFDVGGYAYRLKFSATLSDSTGVAPIIDTIVSIPAAGTVPAATFPALFNDRLLLCGNRDTGELNRVDYSAANAPDVWGGEDSSDGGGQALYFGAGGAITAAAQLYNRYGSEVYRALVVFKDSATYFLTGGNPTGDDRFTIHVMSENIGCPAPLTVAPAEVGFETSENVKRNVVFFLSSSGPYLCDGSIIQPVPGIDNYFDQTEAECINYAAIENARGWWDRGNDEYNLLIPSGTGQVAPNVWLAFDAVHKKWFEKVPASYPVSAWQVDDADGGPYCYAGFSDGFMRRLENGTAWDSSAIAQTIETGDFFPEKNPWWLTQIRMVKLAAVDITESATATITDYSNTSATGNSLTGLDLTSGTDRLCRLTQDANFTGWSHRFKFAASTSSTPKGFQPIMFCYQYTVDKLAREEH